MRLNCCGRRWSLANHSEECFEIECKEQKKTMKQTIKRDFFISFSSLHKYDENLTAQSQSLAQLKYWYKNGPEMVKQISRMFNAMWITFIFILLIINWFRNFTCPWYRYQFLFNFCLILMCVIVPPVAVFVYLKLAWLEE